MAALLFTLGCASAPPTSRHEQPAAPTPPPTTPAPPPAASAQPEAATSGGLELRFTGVVHGEPAGLAKTLRTDPGWLTCWDEEQPRGEITIRFVAERHADGFLALGSHGSEVSSTDRGAKGFVSCAMERLPEIVDGAAAEPSAAQPFEVVLRFERVVWPADFQAAYRVRYRTNISPDREEVELEPGCARGVYLSRRREGDDRLRARHCVVDASTCSRLTHIINAAIDAALAPPPPPKPITLQDLQEGNLGMLTSHPGARTCMERPGQPDCVPVTPSGAAFRLVEETCATPWVKVLRGNGPVKHGRERERQ